MRFIFLHKGKIESYGLNRLASVTVASIAYWLTPIRYRREIGTLYGFPEIVRTSSVPFSVTRIGSQGLPWRSGRGGVEK
jgi:hypothetical protein